MKNYQNLSTGKLISEKRKEKGYTQSDLANLIGVSNKAVSKWETDSGMPDISLLIPISKILELSSDELLNGKPSFFNIIKSNFILFFKNKNSETKKNKKEILKFNILTFLLIFLLFISCFYITINIDYFFVKIDRIGAMLEFICNSVIFIILGFSVYFIINTISKNSFYILSLTHFLFSIIAILSLIYQLHNIDFSSADDMYPQFLITILFSNYIIFYFIGLILTIILYKLKNKKTEN